MKTTAVFFGVVVLAAFCSGLPAQSKKDEVEAVPPVRTYGDQPVVDTGYFSGWDNPFSGGSSFGGIFENLEGIMTRMRQQISSLLNRFPGISKGSTNSSEEFPGFSGVDLPGFPHIPEIDLSKGNTTSVTKVIDGHTVVINETEYKNEDDFGGTFFKVRIIDVKPDTSDLTTEKEAEAVPEPKENREEIENSFENEIPKSKEAYQFDNAAHSTENIDDGFENLETFDDVDPIEQAESISTNQREWFDVSPVDAVDSNDIDNVKETSQRQLPIDLSRDTYVNEILARNGAPTNPDAEVFVVPETSQKTDVNQQRHLEPVDLSRDTYVNEILAQSGRPTNPDAAVFFVPNNPAAQIASYEKFIDPR